MKRFVCASLALLMLAGFAACGGGKDSPANPTTTPVATETEPPETERTDGLPDTDMNGFTLTILHDDGTSVSWIIGTLEAEEQTGEFINDAIYDRNMYIEERFNCKFNPVTDPKVTTRYEPIVTSGDDGYDIIMLVCSDLLKRLNLVTDFGKLPYISWDEVWWNPAASDAFYIADKRMAACGNFTLSYMCSVHTVVFNKNLWSDLQIKENPYQLVREGKWTIDKMFEFAALAIADLNGDGKMTVEDDRYGYASTVRGYMNQLCINAGYKVIDKDKDNIPYFNLANNEQMMTYMLKLLNKTISDPYMLGNSYTTSVHTGGSSDFKTGKSLFASPGAKGITGYREMEDDFGILPGPKQNEEQENYITSSGAGEVATLPRSASPDHYENVGMLLEAMSFRSQTVLADAFKEVCLQSRYARDADSGEMLDILFSTITFDEGFVLFTNQFYNKLVENTFWTKNTALASTIASMRESIEQTISDTVDAAMQMP